MTPAISVIVPFRDARAALPGVVDALAAQTLTRDSFEVIWIDDGSRDGGGDWLRERLEPHWRLLALPRGCGAYAARNAALSVATGGHFAFTDADCRPHPDWLAEGLAALDSAPRAAGRIAVELSSGSLAERADAKRFLRQEHYVREGFGATANLFVRRSVFEAVGVFIEDLRSGGDQEFGWRCSAAGIPIVYAERAVVFHPARSSIREVLSKGERVGFGSGQLLRRRGMPLTTVARRAVERLRVAARPPGDDRHTPRPGSRRSPLMGALDIVVFLATVAGGLRGFLSAPAAGRSGGVGPQEVTHGASKLLAGHRNGEPVAGRSRRAP